MKKRLLIFILSISTITFGKSQNQEGNWISACFQVNSMFDSEVVPWFSQSDGFHFGIIYFNDDKLPSNVDLVSKNESGRTHFQDSIYALALEASIIINQQASPAANQHFEIGSIGTPIAIGMPGVEVKNFSILSMSYASTFIEPHYETTLALKRIQALGNQYRICQDFLLLPSKKSIKRPRR